ncbi:MAG: protein-L-isoaspartate(D-aspartate) O-methyltransferase [Ktedonobacteraceae bacterium]|nr:protein-L-isoaspartate(D-aspartate) O-methyltransferase [Ktedonobacteraceae bacterium]
MVRNFDVQRQQLISSLYQSGINDQRVLNAMANIPRELFIGESLSYAAYADSALPIDEGQTISQPLIVAAMTQALQLSGQERVLEIGTGSGYQTAILARLARHVYSVERYPLLSYQAARRLARLRIWNASLFVGDGSAGWPAEAPYERIIVTASAPSLPSPLLEQLLDEGIMVIPIGNQQKQSLEVIHLHGQEIRSRSLGRCVFVPLVGEGGWREGK